MGDASQSTDRRAVDVRPCSAVSDQEFSTPLFLAW